MKKTLLAALILLALVLAFPLAGEAGHTRVFIGANFGFGFPGGWGPPVSPAWGYWHRPVVVTPAAPPATYYFGPPVVIRPAPPVLLPPPRPCYRPRYGTYR
jgi:hypothetical protein